MSSAARKYFRASKAVMSDAMLYALALKTIVRWLRRGETDTASEVMKESFQYRAAWLEEGKPTYEGLGRMSESRSS